MAFFFSVITTSVAWAGMTEFKELNLGDRVVTNAYVSTATPLDVVVMWDGGGKTFKRQELPPGLKELYPYDARKVDEYLKQQEAEREKRIQQAKLKQQRAGQELKAALLGQRQSLQQRIAALEKELAKIHAQTDASRPRFRRRLTGAEIQDLERLTMRQRELRGQIDDFNERIATIDTQLASLT